jgi:hypothetical protein
MGSLLGEIGALGLAVAFTSPGSVVAVIVLLSMPSGLRRALGFIGGWLIGIAGIGLIVVFVLHGQDFSSRSTSPSRAASIAEVILGALLIVWPLIAFRRPRPAGGGPSAPKWLDRIEGLNWLVSLAVGAIMLSYALSFAAMSEILKADLSAADDAVAVAVFALTSVATVAAPVIVVLVRPAQSEQTLARLKAWLLGNSRGIVLVVLIAVGVFLVARGIHDLAG